MIKVQKLETPFLPAKLEVFRWKYVLFGWHFLTIYRHRLKFKTGPNYSETYWIYFSQNFGFGIQLPWWGHYED